MVATMGVGSPQVRRERDAFLCGRPVSEAVRAEVVESWRRSSSSGVVPDALDLAVASDVDVESEFCRAAAPVLDRLNERLDSSRTALVLSGPRADILQRWAGDTAVSVALDEVEALPGVCLDEGRAGTNGLGTTMALDRPVVISGAEHFADRYQPFTCAGAPVRHPSRGHGLGVVTLVCRYQDTNRLMLPIVLEAVDHIRARLLEQTSTVERLLLDRYLARGADTPAAVVVIGADVLLANRAASELLSHVDDDRLRAEAAALGRGVGVGRLSLPSGEELVVRGEGVTTGREVVGHVLELSRLGPEPARPGPLPRPRVAPRPAGPARVPAEPSPLARLGGRGRAWQGVLAAARRHARFDLPVLVHGEAGTGKLALVEAMWAEARLAGTVEVADAALVPFHGLTDFLHGLHGSLHRPDGLVVLRHAELLERRAALAVSGLLDEAGRSGGARLASTATSSSILGEGPAVRGALGDRLAVVQIGLPPLRDRPEDIGAVVEAVAREGGGRHRWRPDALEALEAGEWPGNARQLRNLVVSTCAGRPAGDVTRPDLPPQFQRPGRRALTQIERAELAVIVAGLREAGGNKVEAARRLGISRSTLYRKVSAYRIDAAAR
ncbi:MAG: GAF domain-containing protein [Acidimicrobiia bacterium]|nr:GAF domain-containing protein [Acidimicrobiia bacterium]